MFETRIVTAHVPVDLAERVDRLAEQHGCSRNWVINQALIAWTTRGEKANELTARALAEVDADTLIDDARAVAWIESLGTDFPLPIPQP